MSRITDHPDFPTLSHFPPTYDPCGKAAIERLYRNIDAGIMADCIAALAAEGR